MDLSNIISLCIEWPLLALLPALTFAGLFYLRRRRPILLAAIAWFVYFLYEQGMKLRILCSGECNIRIDLLVLYPILALLSVLALTIYIRAARSDRRT